MKERRGDVDVFLERIQRNEVAQKEPVLVRVVVMDHGSGSDSGDEGRHSVLTDTRSQTERSDL